MYAFLILVLNKLLVTSELWALKGHPGKSLPNKEMVSIFLFMINDAPGNCDLDKVWFKEQR